jgi:hypothetical protein
MYGQNHYTHDNVWSNWLDPRSETTPPFPNSAQWLLSHPNPIFIVVWPPFDPFILSPSIQLRCNFFAQITKFWLVDQTVNLIIIKLCIKENSREWTLHVKIQSPWDVSSSYYFPWYSEPTHNGTPCKMDVVWKRNMFHCILVPWTTAKISNVLNHPYTSTYLVAIKSFTYLLLTHCNHLHPLPTYICS